MPSNRKRIGFLPSEEVHEIIEKICRENKLSQSKITGILVEEALESRGFIKKSSFSAEKEAKNSVNNNVYINESNGNYQYHNLNKEYMNEDLKMINEFIRFKFFKRVMKENNNFD